MSPAVTPGGKAPSLDFGKSLLETFSPNERAKQLLLGNISESAWRATPPSGKGRTIADIADHIHNVRPKWLSAADKSAKVPAKLQPDEATRLGVQKARKESAAAVDCLSQKALDDPAGKVPNFKPNVVAFIGYLIAQDSHPRGQIGMRARQVAHPVDRRAAYGLWEWGWLRRDCGFGSTTGGPTSK